jgi:hypothetical protein
MRTLKPVTLTEPVKDTFLRIRRYELVNSQLPLLKSRLCCNAKYHLDIYVAVHI